LTRCRRAALAVLGFCVAAGADASAKGPDPALFCAPSIPRVRIEVGRNHLLVVEEVNLPRGDYRGGDIEVYVAFGGPGVPRAIDAHLVPVERAALAPSPTESGTALVTSRVTRKPTSVPALLGRKSMAGIVVRVPERALRRAFAPGGMAAIRVRSVHPLPSADARGVREALVRLGIDGGPPMALARIELAAAEKGLSFASASAELCGPEADRFPLAMHVTPLAAGALPRDPSVPRPLAPVLAVRHGSDDLCVRFRMDESARGAP
jgi:hypothetical protein